MNKACQHGKPCKDCTEAIQYALPNRKDLVGYGKGKLAIRDTTKSYKIERRDKLSPGKTKAEDRVVLNVEVTAWLHDYGLEEEGTLTIGEVVELAEDIASYFITKVRAEAIDEYEKKLVGYMEKLCWDDKDIEYLLRGLK